MKCTPIAYVCLNEENSEELVSVLYCKVPGIQLQGENTGLGLCVTVTQGCVFVISAGGLLQFQHMS